MKKIYKVFVSSTFTDLEDERKEVTQALLESDCMPSGMELFHAADISQWNLIQNEISLCDFYIVIIAGRYGSVHPKTNKSYTQMEYEYAYKLGIPIFAFIYKSPDDLPAKKSEKNSKYQKKLDEFKNRIVNERIVKFWTNPYDLASSIKTSIFRAIKDNPPGGWVRYKDIVNNVDNINVLDILHQINELRNIILTNYKDTFVNDKRNNNINSSELLNHLNELKSTITSNDFNTNTPINQKVPEQIYYSDYANEHIYQINSKNITFSLNSMHVNAINEITNMIFSAGITGLSAFFNILIKADYSYLQICENSIDIERIINIQNKYCLLSEFSIDNKYITSLSLDNINGKILLNFSLKLVEKISNLLTLDYSHYINNFEYDYFKSALHELCNIFVGSSLTALSVILNSNVKMSATIKNIDIQNIDFFENDDTIVISKFSNDRNESNLFDAYLILEPTPLKSLLEQANGESIT